MPVSVSIDGAPPTTLQVPSGWADYTLPLPPDVQPGETVNITILSPTRSPAQLQPGSSDTRNLGVGLDLVSLINQ
jgi:hypothetical protein